MPFSTFAGMVKTYAMVSVIFLDIVEKTYEESDHQEVEVLRLSLK